MTNKKEQERSALHSTIWRVANDMRGSVDGWDFKQYVLGILFYRFISENLRSYINEKQQEAGDHDFNYAALSDSNAARARDLILEEKGFFIHPGELFENVRKRAASDANPLLINDDRFTPAGVLAPKSKADLAFVMHALSWLATGGTAAIVSFPGVMYRGGAEQKIRKYLVNNNFVDAVIQLPTDLFFGTTIATCILVMKKNKSDTGVLFIDATKEFARGSAKNKLNEDHIQKILDCYTDRSIQEHFSYVADHKEIADNDYNLSVSSYVEAKDTREVINITDLNAELKTTVAKIDGLRTDIDAIVSEIEGDAT